MESYLSSSQLNNLKYGWAVARSTDFSSKKGMVALAVAALVIDLGLRWRKNRTNWKLAKGQSFNLEMKLALKNQELFAKKSDNSSNIIESLKAVQSIRVHRRNIFMGMPVGEENPNPELREGVLSVPQHMHDILTHFLVKDGEAVSPARNQIQIENPEEAAVVIQAVYAVIEGLRKVASNKDKTLVLKSGDQLEKGEGELILPRGVYDKCMKMFKTYKENLTGSSKCTFEKVFPPDNQLTIHFKSAKMCGRAFFHYQTLTKDTWYKKVCKYNETHNLRNLTFVLTILGTLGLAIGVGKDQRQLIFWSVKALKLGGLALGGCCLSRPYSFS